MANSFRHVFLRKPEHAGEEQPMGEHFSYVDSYTFTIERVLQILSAASIVADGEPTRRLGPGDAILDGNVVYLVRPDKALETGTQELAQQLRKLLPYGLGRDESAPT